MSNQLRKHYDIIINGGGIVGFTLLNFILKSPYLSRCKVLLLEQASTPVTFKQPPRYQEKTSDSEWNNSETDSSRNKTFSNRVSSITGLSKTVLQSVGAWNTVEQYSKNVKSIKVWNYDYSHKIIFKQIQSSQGWQEQSDKNVIFSVVENNRLSQALLENIYKHDRANDVILWSHSLQDLLRPPGQGFIDVLAKNTQTGEELSCQGSLILGCDGFKSKVRDLARLNYFETDLNKTAIVGTIKMGTFDGRNSENDIAYQRFSNEKDTVAALLPLDNEYSSFVISAPNDYSKFLIECDDETFTEEFNKLLSNGEAPRNPILGRLHDITNKACDYVRSLSLPLQFEAAGIDHQPNGIFETPPKLDSVVEDSRASFPLVFGTTTPRMVGSLQGEQYSQIALLGDSSHRVHPLAGQGLNLGIQDAMELVQQLEFKMSYGERIFDSTNQFLLHEALRKYELKRQSYIVPMSAGILSMQSLFKLMPSSLVSGVNRCNAIKSASVSFANGCR